MSGYTAAGGDAIAIVGLGYVGLPLAAAFARAGDRVIGFDVDHEKIQAYINGADPTGEVGSDALAAVSIEFTSDPKRIRCAKYVIVAVPTPVCKDKAPDLRPVESASRLVGQNLAPGALVVFESTVYPGVTEEICLPILEAESGMRGGADFKIGYSPERVNPGDRVHTLDTIVKVVSGMDEEALDQIAALYARIVRAGVHRAPSIRVAEAAKVIENAQRDVNIAFMNELAIIFDRLGLDTGDVLAAAGTKWNFLRFRPGLVGGHCIGVDPYYLAHRSERSGYAPDLILAARRLNEGMSRFVAQKAVDRMRANGIDAAGSKVLIVGLTFKENVPEIRNSKVADIIGELLKHGAEVAVYDCCADKREVRREYGIELADMQSVSDIDCMILAVAHEAYGAPAPQALRGLFKPGQRPVLLDLRGALDKAAFIAAGFDFYRL